MTFLAKLILGIPGSQIEIEKMFKSNWVLTTLWQCHLQVESLDLIITIVKNWPNDLHVNCMPNTNMKYYLKIKKSLADDNYKLIENRIF